MYGTEIKEALSNISSTVPDFKRRFIDSIFFNKSNLKSLSSSSFSVETYNLAKAKNIELNIRT